MDSGTETNTTGDSIAGLAVASAGTGGSACFGRRTATTSSIETTVPTTHVRKITSAPSVNVSAAVATRASSLPTEATTLRISCSPLWNRPMKAPSSTKAAAVQPTPTVKMATPRGAVLSAGGSRRFAPTIQTKPSAAETTPDTRSAARTSGRSRPPYDGSSPVSIVPSPRVPIRPSSVIAEIAAAPIPTVAGGNARAATAQ